MARRLLRPLIGPSPQAPVQRWGIDRRSCADPPGALGSGFDPMEQGEPTRAFVRFGVFELDRRSGELRKDGVRVRLQEQPLRVLDALLAEPGEPVTREALRQRLWPDDTFVDFDNGLNRAIDRLRAALGDEAGNPRFIETLERRGYRFIAPVATPTRRRRRPRRRARARRAGAAAAVRWPAQDGVAAGALAAAAVLALAIVPAAVLRRCADTLRTAPHAFPGGAALGQPHG